MSPIVELPNLAAFSGLQDLLLHREMPGFRQVVAAPEGLLGDDELDWLRAHHVEVRIGTIVPEGQVFVFREEVGLDV